MSFVSIVIGNKKFFSGKQVIVKVNESFSFISSYKAEAFKIACKHLSLEPDECSILSWSYLGDDVEFIV